MSDQPPPTKRIRLSERRIYLLIVLVIALLFLLVALLIYGFTPTMCCTFQNIVDSL